jgi:hypothetical protein
VFLIKNIIISNLNIYRKKKDNDNLNVYHHIFLCQNYLNKQKKIWFQIDFFLLCFFFKSINVYARNRIERIKLFK